MVLKVSQKLLQMLHFLAKCFIFGGKCYGFFWCRDYIFWLFGQFVDRPGSQKLSCSQKCNNCNTKRYTQHEKCNTHPKNITFIVVLNHNSYIGSPQLWRFQKYYRHGDKGKDHAKIGHFSPYFSGSGPVSTCTQSLDPAND